MADPIVFVLSLYCMQFCLEWLVLLVLRYHSVDSRSRLVGWRHFFKIFCVCTATGPIIAAHVSERSSICHYSGIFPLIFEVKCSFYFESFCVTSTLKQTCIISKPAGTNGKRTATLLKHYCY
jgi:hypothetical protein